MSLTEDGKEEKKDNVGEDSNQEAKICDVEEHNSVEAHEWPRTSSSQQKARNLYELRHKISANEAPSFSRIDISSEALLAKDLYNEENLLMYAASMGRGEWFKRIVKEIREQIGVQALVKELRELDINGAHILSRASASRENQNCFQDVYDELREVLGMGGVMEQLEAEDHMGRNIMMHAARSNHPVVFTKVRKLYEMRMMKPSRWDSENQTPFQGSENQTPSLKEQWGGKVKKKDRTGRTMLHHAAEAGCLAVLQKVIKVAEDEGVYDDMMLVDHNDRTPLMLTLRNSWGSYGGMNDQDAKFKLLWEKGGQGNWLTLRKIESIRVTTESKDESHPVKAKTELFHAVRGGLSSLRLFLKHVTQDNTNKIELDGALGMEETVEEGKTSIDKSLLQQRGHGMLLAAAAKGGHVDVMEQVVFAIKNGYFQYRSEETEANRETEAKTAIDTDGGASPIAESKVTNETTAFDETKVDDQSRTSHKEAMKKAIESIKEAGSSFFTFAVMSGNPKAADYALKIIGETFDEAEEVWDLVSGASEKTSPLTHAVISYSESSASIPVSGLSMETSLFTHAIAPLEAASDGGKEMFDKVYDCLKKAAKTGSPKDELERLAHHFVPTRRILERFDQTNQPKTIETRVTPLAAAALRGNWVLFRHVYDEYERLVGRKWFRGEVVEQLPKSPPEAFRLEMTKEMHETTHVDRDLSLRGDLENISAVIWKDIVEAFQHATPIGKNLMKEKLKRNAGRNLATFRHGGGSLYLTRSKLLKQLLREGSSRTSGS